MGELIRELDVASVSDTVIEIYSLKFSQADDLANLLGLILNAQSPAHRHPRSLHSCPPGVGVPIPGGAPMREAGASTERWRSSFGPTSKAVARQNLQPP